MTKNAYQSKTKETSPPNMTATPQRLIYCVLPSFILVCLQLFPSRHIMKAKVQNRRKYGDKIFAPLCSGTKTPPPLSPTALAIWPTAILCICLHLDSDHSLYTPGTAVLTVYKISTGQANLMVSS